MNVTQRMFTSIIRLKVRFSILFVIVVLLMTLVFASISVFNAVINTDRNLHNQLLAITTIHLILK